MKTIYYLLFFLFFSSLRACRFDFIVEKFTKSFTTGPSIFNLNCPDTLKRPAFGEQLVNVTLDVNDPQGNEDLKWVGFDAYLPNSEPSTQAPTVDMFDDGLGGNGDEKAGDGTYSVILHILNDAQLGDHTWIFYAEDLVDNRSDSLIHIITIQ